jgi:hypothetical protein
MLNKRSTDVEDGSAALYFRKSCFKVGYFFRLESFVEVSDKKRSTSLSTLDQ